MPDDLKTENARFDMPPELLNAFAHFISDEIRGFYQSNRGKEFYAEWLKKHPEYKNEEKPPDS